MRKQSSTNGLSDVDVNVDDNEQAVLILPTFYSYPYAPGERPLDVMGRWAVEAEAKQLAAEADDKKRG